MATDKKKSQTMTDEDVATALSYLNDSLEGQLDEMEDSLADLDLPEIEIHYEDIDEDDCEGCKL